MVAIQWRMPQPLTVTVIDEYWRTYSFGTLSEVAKTRHAAIEALIPKLKIAARLSLDDRFLVVRGDLKTYTDPQIARQIRRL